MKDKQPTITVIHTHENVKKVIVAKCSEHGDFISVKPVDLAPTMNPDEPTCFRCKGGVLNHFHQLEQGTISPRQFR